MNNSLKIALIGYGKMGKEIEKIIIQRGHTVAFIIDKDDILDESYKHKCDVAIEFTEPTAAVQNILTCASLSIPIVVGTTGWYEHYNTICNQINSKQGTLFTATNFSIGVNLFFKANQQLAKLMSKHNDYSVSMDEIHHTQKKDAPSGTAITTAEHILSVYPHKKGWECPQDESNFKNDPQMIQIEAIREDKVPGTHSVYWKSEVDTIELKHTAHNRIGFATGAVIAAEWAYNKKGCFTMDNLLGF